MQLGCLYYIKKQLYTKGVEILYYNMENIDYLKEEEYKEVEEKV